MNNSFLRTRFATSRNPPTDAILKHVNNLFTYQSFGRLALLVFAVTVFLLISAIALADGISIGGQDASGQMKDVQTLVTTLQNIGFHWVAPLLGGGLAIFGILQIATRRIGMGILALAGGGALFAVERIANSLSHIAGN